ncbi:MAG: type IV secretion system protein, partial [Burkholderiales bacterium]|nr:type IV secretion system protein [Burkholderiales bacterium]
ALFAELQASRQTTQSNIKERLTNIESTMAQIDSATDSKAIADLQARLSAEVSAFNASVAEANQGLEQQKELYQQQKENEARQQSIANFSALSESEVNSMLKFK